MFVYKWPAVTDVYWMDLICLIEVNKAEAAAAAVVT